jgi:hypothetical protein
VDAGREGRHGYGAQVKFLSMKKVQAWEADARHRHIVFLERRQEFCRIFIRRGKRKTENIYNNLHSNSTLNYYVVPISLENFTYIN